LKQNVQKLKNLYKTSDTNILFIKNGPFLVSFSFIFVFSENYNWKNDLNFADGWIELGSSGVGCDPTAQFVNLVYKRSVLKGSF